MALTALQVPGTRNGVPASSLTIFPVIGSPSLFTLLVVFLLFPLNYCLIRLGGCDNAALVQTMYQLDGRIRPLGIEHGLFLFVPSAAMGDQSRYEELQIVYFKWASVFFPFLSLIVFPMFLPLWRDWWRSRLDRKG